MPGSVDAEPAEVLVVIQVVVQLGRPDVEEEEAADLLNRQNREANLFGQREAELEVGPGDRRSGELAEFESAQLVQAAHAVEHL